MSDDRLVFQGSPFLPQFDLPAVMRNIMGYIEQAFEPAAAIAQVIDPIMMVHTTLLRLDHTTIATFGAQEIDLHHLTLGYQYSLETILASAVCRQVPTREERWDLFEQILATTHRGENLLVQEQMKKDINATSNLLALDPSATLIFQFLRNYPFSNDEYFLAGIEIAERIFFGLALEVAKQTGDSSWLSVDYSRPPYLPPENK